MKKRILWVLMILAVGLLSTNVLKGIPLPQEDSNKDNYGKVIGQVVDPETGGPVNGVFIYKFLKSNESDPYIRPLKSGKTDEKGYFSSELEPNVYCVAFEPESTNSKYCFEPHPYLNEKYKFIVKVEKGKITEFRKKATVGGELKIKLVDTTGKLINPKLEFTQKGRIDISIMSANIPLSKSAKGEFINGEMVMKGVFPDNYTLLVEFPGLGIGRIQEENVKVEKEKTTEVAVTVNLDDNTGMEGKILDRNGVAINNAEVILFQIKPRTMREFEVYTDEHGGYRFLGLQEGLYSLMVSAGWKVFILGNVEIQKNIMMKKDITLNFSVDEK